MNSSTNSSSMIRAIRAIRRISGILSTRAGHHPVATLVRHQHTRPIASPASLAAASPSGLLARVSSRSFSSHLHDRLTHYAHLPQRGVTLKQMMSVTENPSDQSLLSSAKFLHAELPIRLAKRIKELESLPYGLSQTPAVRAVQSWYVQSFGELLTCPEPQTMDDDRDFTKLLESIYNRHNAVIPYMALGVLQMKENLGASTSSSHADSIVSECPFLHEFLNKFYASRMAIRVLISQHVALHSPKPGWIGTITLNTSPVDIVQSAVTDAVRVAEQELGACPEVNISGDRTITFPIIPSHLHHCVFEIVKNSLRAVIERHQSSAPSAMPSIDITVSHDDREFAVKISDQGGGIPRKDMTRIWSYLWSTYQRSVTTQELITRLSQSSLTSAPLAGFGYGLSIARLYARFFGGDLQVISLPNHGTDAYLYLNRLGNVDLFLD